MKKGFVLGLATGVVLTGASLVLANSQIQAILNDQIKVTLNGQVQEFRDETTNPITYKDRTYLPLRTIANLVGVNVDYDASSNTAILKTKNYNNDSKEESIDIEQELVNKYKLSDSISLSYDSDKKDFYNIFNRGELKEKVVLTIGGKNHTIYAKPDLYYTENATLLIDDKEIIGDGFNSSINGLGVIFLENKPYIVVHIWEGSASADELFSINDNFELEYEKTFEELYYVGGKYIAPEFFHEIDSDHYGQGDVIGYWYFENGEWKYINRSINGQKLIADDGTLSDELRIEKTNYIGEGMFYSGFYVTKLNSNIVLTSMSKYRIRKMYSQESRVFDIEMLEDSVWGVANYENAYEHPEKYDENGNWIGEIKNKEIIKAGTIIKEVNIH